MARRKLNFIKAKMNLEPDGDDIVTPIDEQTGEEIDNVAACSVESAEGECTIMIIKVLII